MSDEYHSGLVPVRFYETAMGFNAGEIAGFPYPEAAALVVRGVAVYVTPPPGVDEQGVPIPATETEGDGAGV